MTTLWKARNKSIQYQRHTDNFGSAPSPFQKHVNALLQDDITLKECIRTLFMSCNHRHKCSLHVTNSTFPGPFLEWLPSCSYDPTKNQTSNHLAELSKSADLYLTRYDQLLFLCNFNARVKDLSVKILVLVTTLQVWLRGLHVLRTLRNLLV